MKLLIGLTVFTLAVEMAFYNNKQGEPSAQGKEYFFCFGVFADAQYCDCEPSGTRFYRNSLLKLNNALQSFREAEVSFVINLGDLIEKDYDSFGPVMDAINKSGIKIHHVAGNHDFSVEQKDKKHVLQLLTGGKKGYYSFVNGKFRFIVLDGTEISTYGPGKKSIIKNAEFMISQIREAGDPNWHEWNGGISSVQLFWLRKQLDEAIASEEKVFIICHFPVWPENEHNLFNYREVIDLLKNYPNIIAFFSGHNHAGNYGNTNMIHFVNFKGMVETDELNSYAIVEVYRNKIWIKGFGRERSMILAY